MLVFDGRQGCGAHRTYVHFPATNRQTMALLLDPGAFHYAAVAIKWKISKSLHLSARPRPVDLPLVYFRARTDAQHFAGIVDAR
jgi:hypothetical protein